MATGDLANNLRKLQKELKLIKYSDNVDLTGLSQGTPTAFLPIYHYLFTSYSHSIAELISSSDTELFGKTDFRFIEAVYKLMRDLFSYKPPVTKEQFFNAGFAERKIIMCADVIQMIREKNKVLQPNRKPTTTAVSTLSHLNKKTTRPKTADSAKSAVQPLPSKAPSRSATSDQKQVKFAPDEVVNELYRPVRPETSRHVAHKDPPSPVTIVNMSPVVTKEVVEMDEHPARGFKYAVVTPAVAKLPHKSSRSRETNVNKGLTFQDSGDIEVVNAITPDTSLYEPLHSTGINHEEDHNLISTLNQAVEVITERLSVVENSVKENPTVTDPALLNIISGLQKQIENLTARMVLIENRVSIIESKTDAVSPSRISSTEVNTQKDPNKNYLTKEICPSETLTSCQSPKEIQSTVLSKNRPVEYSRNTMLKSRQDEIKRDVPQMSQAGPVDNYNAGEIYSTENPASRISYQTDSRVPQIMDVGKEFQNGSMNVTENTLLSSDEQYKYIGANHAGDSSIPSYLASGNQFSFALSPIRTIKDTSGFKAASNATGEDTFALETEDDARRSSTPTDFKDLPLKPSCNEHDSLSFQCGDVSMQQRVDRIKNMMVSTKSMLNK